MKLAYFTPLPPSKSGIADYNAELLPYLTKNADITVFVNNNEELNCDLGGGIKILHADHIDRSQFDLIIYHQGNNPHHEYIYDVAVQIPGLTVLHEACLHHLISWKTLGRNDQNSYWDEMFFAYGKQGAKTAQIRFGGVGGEYQHFLLPLNRRIVQNSLGIIVHNDYAVSRLEGLSNDKPVEIIPHHLSPSVYNLDNIDKSECRKILNIPEDTFAVASFGFVTNVKRLDIAMESFKRLLAVHPNARYYIVGEDHWRNSIATRITSMGLSDRVIITGYTDEEKFFRYLQAIDLLVNLRYPTAGETSGTLIRALGAGIPVIVTDFAQFADLPDNICMKVPLGDEEIDILYSHMRNIAFQPELRNSIGRAAKEYIRRENDIKSSAEKYLAFAERIIKSQHNDRGGARLELNPQRHLNIQTNIRVEATDAINYMRGFFTDDPAALDYISTHAKRLIETLRLIPQGDKDRRILELSSYMQLPPLVAKYGSYNNTVITGRWEEKAPVKINAIENAETGEKLQLQMYNVDVERDRFPFDDESFDVVLCCELIEHLTADPMHMMLEINRVLKFGGMAIITTPNVSSAFSIGKALNGNSPYVFGEYVPSSPGDRHSREYTPFEIRDVLLSSGFKVINLFTKDLWCQTDEPFLASLDYTGIPRNLRGDNIFAVGCKLTTIFDRYPDGLYD